MARLIGRAIASLADDAELLTFTGQALGIGALARRYGIGVST